MSTKNGLSASPKKILSIRGENLEISPHWGAPPAVAAAEQPAVNPAVQAEVSPALQTSATWHAACSAA